MALQTSIAVAVELIIAHPMYGNEGRQPSSVYDSLGEVHRPGSGPNQVNPKGVGCLRYGG